MRPMPMSPRQSPTEIGGAAVQWLCSRRGRTLLLSVIVLTFILGLAGMRHSEAITERYHALSDYQWRPNLPSLPKLSKTPFKAPSNTTLQLENGEIEHLPPKLEKTTPNFHLLMTSEKDSDSFCKTTLSAMLLNYPPPSIVNFGRTFTSQGRKEISTLYGIREYLHNEKLVHDEDLMLVVDGQDTWFQLPSDVIIKQYEAVVEYANARLLKKYGLDKNGYQKFNQTIVFGAQKFCEDNHTACKYAPRSMLPSNMYGAGEESSTEDMPARYLNSRVVIGPAKDMKFLFDEALKKYEKTNSNKQTVQSVLTTMFAEQQLRRDAILIQDKSATWKLREWVGRTGEEELAAEHRLKAANITYRPDKKYEFSIGLDYTHTLFQPLIYTTLDELLPLIHDNSTNLSKYRHPNTLTPHLSLPPALGASKLPFWSSNFYLHTPSPNNKPTYIDKLEFANTLDQLPNRHTPWSNVPLIQNTYTGTIPTLLLRVPNLIHTPSTSGSSAQASFNNLWFAPYKRVLLRQYFRNPQSPNGYHNSLVGGDRFWDQRGGRGGIWTSKEQLWLPWGEVDGVCGTLAQLKQVFDDGKGVWMHELEDKNEEQRVKDEISYKKALEEKKKKDEEKEQQKIEAAAKKKEEEKERQRIETAAKEDYEQRKKEGEKKEKEKAEKEKAAKEKAEKAKTEKENATSTTSAEVNSAATATATATKHEKRWIA